MAVHATQLYIISPDTIDDLDDFLEILPHVLQKSGATCFQLRLKQGHKDYQKIAQTIAPIVQGLDIAFVIADDIKLAQSCGADGVHLETPIEDNDIITADDVKSAKSILGKDAIVGVSSRNNRDSALDCAEAGADYLSFGPVFHSPNKPHLHKTGMDMIDWWVEMVEIPCVAIGGIRLDNLPQILGSGVDFAGVISGIWDGDPIYNAEMFAKILKSG